MPTGVFKETSVMYFSQFIVLFKLVTVYYLRKII